MTYFTLCIMSGEYMRLSEATHQNDSAACHVWQVLSKLFSKSWISSKASPLWDGTVQGVSLTAPNLLLLLIKSNISGKLTLQALLLQTGAAN